MVHKLCKPENIFLNDLSKKTNNLYDKKNKSFLVLQHSNKV